ncbi:MAG: TIGR02584 family CRISPR-associated protein [Zoogloeaceae bacterium]|jgi:CRISPR-associated protein (TIGR02584 family)|nr:TIGR02584 family CRISPR-associated protein [Zoogloeaceae bacterium]
MNPTDFPRRILLAVTGLSPQIVTETLYALSREDTPFIPTEIHLITTIEGAEQAKRSLLSEQKGWFHRLCHDYGLPGIHFDADDGIHILRAGDGRPLEDIRSHEDNLLAADFITEKVRELSADDAAALHVSIAGGRKTMGFFLGYALSLFGRPQDRLSHVLVSAPFESSWDFFYPTPNENIITTRDEKLCDTRDARVILADIPFVSLRHGLPADLLSGRAHYIDVVQQARQRLGPPSLEIRLREKTIRAGGGNPFRLPPSQLALLCLFARRAQRGDETLTAPAKGGGDKALAQAYLRELALISPDNDLDATRRALRNGMDGDFFSSLLSKLRRRIREHLHAAALPYLIDDGGRRPHRYRLAIAVARIEIK